MPQTGAQKSSDDLPLHGCRATNLLNVGQVGKRLRFCLPHMLSRCPATENNISLSAACQTYSFPICFVPETALSKTGYRLISYNNPHCATCNGFDLSEEDFTFCLATDFLPLGTTDSHVFLKSIWNFAVSESKDVLKDNECSHDHQIYDSYSRVCRNMSCVSDSTESVCAFSQVSSNIDDICCQSQESWILFTTILPIEPYFLDEIMPCFLDLLNISIEDIESKWEVNRFLGRVSGHVMLKNNGSACSLARDLNYVFKSLAQESSECRIESVEYFYMCAKFPRKDRHEKCGSNWYNGTAQDFVLMKQILQMFLFMKIKQSFLKSL